MRAVCVLIHTQCEVVSFDNCLVYFCSSVFDDNYSSTESDSETDGDTSALAAFRFPVTFNGTNHFVGNIGGGITLLNTKMDAHGEMLFMDNSAVFGGGIAMDDRCLVCVLYYVSCCVCCVCYAYLCCVCENM